MRRAWRILVFVLVGCAISVEAETLRDNSENPQCMVKVPSNWHDDPSTPHCSSSPDRRLRVLLVSAPSDLTLDECTRNFIQRHPEGARLTPSILGHERASRIELYDQNFGYSLVWLTVRKGRFAMLTLQSTSTPAPESVTSFVHDSFRWIR